MGAETNSREAAAAARVALAWLRRPAARAVLAKQDEALWQQFLDEAYEGGRKLVRNSNRDTKDRFPKVEVLTLLRTDKQFRKLIRGQFQRWLEQRDRQGPPGEAVEDVGSLQRGQTVEWTQDRQLQRGTVQKARPDRAILQTQDGRTVHMRPDDLDSWNPRIV